MSYFLTGQESVTKNVGMFKKNAKFLFSHPLPPVILTFFLVITSQANFSEIFTVIISYCTTQAEAWSSDELDENAPRKYIQRNLIFINQYPRVSQCCTVSRKETYYPPIFHLYSFVSD